MLRVGILFSYPYRNTSIPFTSNINTSRSLPDFVAVERKRRCKDIDVSKFIKGIQFRDALCCRRILQLLP